MSGKQEENFDTKHSEPNGNPYQNSELKDLEAKTDLEIKNAQDEFRSSFRSLIQSKKEAGIQITSKVIDHEFRMFIFANKLHPDQPEAVAHAHQIFQAVLSERDALKKTYEGENIGITSDGKPVRFNFEFWKKSAEDEKKEKEKSTLTLDPSKIPHNLASASASAETCLEKIYQARMKILKAELAIKNNLGNPNKTDEEKQSSVLRLNNDLKTAQDNFNTVFPQYDQELKAARNTISQELQIWIPELLGELQIETESQKSTTSLAFFRSNLEITYLNMVGWCAEQIEALTKLTKIYPFTTLKLNYVFIGYTKLNHYEEKEIIAFWKFANTSLTELELEHDLFFFNLGSSQFSGEAKELSIFQAWMNGLEESNITKLNLTDYRFSRLIEDAKNRPETSAGKKLDIFINSLIRIRKKRPEFKFDESSLMDNHLAYYKKRYEELRQQQEQEQKRPEQPESVSSFRL